MRWTIYLKALEGKISGSYLDNKSYKNISGLHNGTKLQALVYTKFRIFPHVCQFGRFYSLRISFEKNKKPAADLLTFMWF